MTTDDHAAMAIDQVTPAALLDAALAHALSLAMYNAVGAQQQCCVVRQAASTMACTAMLSLGSAETAEGAVEAPADTAAVPETPQPALAAALDDAADRLPPPVTSAVEVAEGAGGVAQAAAQTAVLALQDAADYLRNVATIAVAAQGVALTQLIANPGNADNYNTVLTACDRLMFSARGTFDLAAMSADTLLRMFQRTEAGTATATAVDQIHPSST